MIRAAVALLLFAAVTAGCYGTPKGTHSGKAGSGGGGGSGGQAGTISGAGGNSGADAGGSGAGQAGTSGNADGSTGGSTGGSGPIFVGGPCVTSPDQRTVEVFGRSSDGHIYRRSFDGSNWGSWISLAALDGTIVDARSDLDCSASASSTHLVATSLNPTGSFLHAFGLGTTYNPFLRELTDSIFAPGPSIADADDTHYSLGALASGGAFPVLYEFGEIPAPQELTPIPTQTDSFRSGPDIAVQPAGASKLTFFAAFDYNGTLSIYYHVINSGGAYWADPVKLSPPTGTFSFSPTICVEFGSFGVYSVNVAAVAAGQLWYARTSSITSPFSPWTQIAANPASSPDCVVAGGPESIVHVVVSNSAGTVIDISGKGMTWVATDLGVPR